MTEWAVLSALLDVVDVTVLETMDDAELSATFGVAAPALETVDDDPLALV